MQCTDPVILNLWHPLAAVAETAVGPVHSSTLLGERVGFVLDALGGVAAWRERSSAPARGGADPDEVSEPLPTRVRYGYVWTSLGAPGGDLFAIPEYDEPDRRNINAATIGINVSAPRAIENFLDMGHFPVVHTDMLGVEPHTEVQASTTSRSPWSATRSWPPSCRILPADGGRLVVDGGADVEYVYRVPHPYCGVLYKSSALDAARRDVIAVFLQPVDEEHTRAHMLLSVLDDENEDKVIRNFQQSIFGQDKPILENQYPKRLPLDPRAETPIRADKSAIAYRRWLSRKGITYGVLPAAN